MKIREFLQTKIWSKRTARKILVCFGIVFGVVAIGGVVIYEIEVRWLTTGERNASKAAMTQIDALQDFGSLTDQEFETKDKQAEVTLENVKRAAVTQRDEQVAFEVEFYLNQTEDDRFAVREALIFWERNTPDGSARTVLGKKLDLSGTELRTWTRFQLHKELK